MRTPDNGIDLKGAPQPFLTETQRASLDAALAAKAAENAAHAKAHHKAVGTGDRKSRHGKGTGAPKKGGAGGKFTWGNLFTNGDTVERTLDKNDPNYDSDEERAVVMHTQQSRLAAEIQAYKHEVVSIVEEYFDSGDIADVAECLEDLGAPDFMHYFVKRLITLALDRKDREREMASVLLSSLYAEVIPAEQVQKGFMSLVESIQDLVLDVPDAPDLLALFIARAVVDDILPPSVVSKIPASPDTAAVLKHKVEVQLLTRHSAEKILRCWGSGAGLTYQDTKDSIARILDEFIISHDAEEAARCLRSLSVPFFHHELVKQALHKAMEVPKEQQALVGLLARLSETGEVSLLQLTKGFKRVSDNLDDLVLDNPAAKEQYAAVIKLVQSSKALEDALDAARNTTSHSTASSVNGAANGSSHAHSIAAFKTAALAAIHEYFNSSDVGEVARRLLELEEPGLQHIFVKHAVTMALDRNDRERELVSDLFANLHPKVISSDQTAMGFTRLLGAADDLVLDCPDAVRLLALFVARAIVDEVLTPAFLTQVLPALRNESLGVSVIKSTGSLLSARHSAERIVNCWHGGALTLERTKAQIKGALVEYTGSRDVSEAIKCLIDLHMPYYHHEVVVEAIELAFAQEQSVDDLLNLLRELSLHAVISQTQMTKGFTRVKSRLDEEALDYGPKAKDAFAGFVERATKEGWLTFDPEA